MFLNVEDKYILKEYSAGKVTTDQTTGYLLDKVAKTSSSVTLLEEVKFFFYYTDSHLKVLTSEIDDELELRYKTAASKMFSSPSDDDDAQHDEQNDDYCFKANRLFRTRAEAV